MRAFVAGIGILLGAVAALLGLIAALFFAYGVWHGGVLKGVHWTIHSNHFLGFVAFITLPEIVGTVCYLIVALPFMALSALFPEPSAQKTQRI